MSTYRDSFHQNDNFLILFYYIILSNSIWQHLLDMTANGNKTVVITTHYIEEARQAHTVSDKK